MCDNTLWNVTLCEILKDVSQNVIPNGKHWLYISTEIHQILIGLGSDLPEENIPMRGYTLEEHDKPEDIPHRFVLKSRPVRGS